MDETRCPKCHKRLTATTTLTGRTELHCVTCESVDPMIADIAKWSESPLVAPQNAEKMPEKSSA